MNKRRLTLISLLLIAMMFFASACDQKQVEETKPEEAAESGESEGAKEAAESGESEGAKEEAESGEAEVEEAAPGASDDAEDGAPGASEEAEETEETEANDEAEFNSDQSNPGDIYDATGFVDISDVVPDAILEIRYYSTYNFTGDRVDGYEEPVALITKEAGLALRDVADILKEQGYRIKIFDAYRPQTAVNDFAEWASDVEDTRMKDYFYPDVDKSILFSSHYIEYKSGHSRGSTIDLTLFDMNTGKEVDMGGPFDFFGELSHPTYTAITEEQYNNRMILRDAMLAGGFKGLETEWWHFTLVDEPYPDTYFSFPVSTESLERERKNDMA